MERYLYLLKQHDLRFQKYRLPKGKAFCLYSSGRQHLGPVRNHRRNDTNINPLHCHSTRQNSHELVRNETQSSAVNGLTATTSNRARCRG